MQVSTQRRRLLDILGDGERTGTDLAVETGRVPTNVFRDLRILLAAGLVVRRTEGLYVYYRATPAARTLGPPAPLLRQRILALLGDGEHTTAQLAHLMDRGRPGVSTDLRILHRAGLVVRRYEGRYAWYSLTAEGWEAL